MAQDKKNGRIKKLSLFLVVFTALQLGIMAQTSLALQLNTYPDIKISNVVTSYASNTDSFGAVGIAEKYISSTGVPTDLTYSNLSLLATIDENGNVTGTFTVFSLNTVYLSGNLISLDFTLGDPTLIFLFTPTGGDLSGDYGTLGGIEFRDTGFGSDGFHSDFQSISAVADVKIPVPEPSTVALLLLGVSGLCFLRKRNF